ncbi:MAG: hypothetical protein KGN34_01905 [Sphingomonadales bacterium]|nr:hypothetical protein [Sphingomonadales bacterium]
MARNRKWLIGLALVALAGPVRAAHDEKDIPYWGSLRTDKANNANMRVGPGEDYRISWIYHRAHLPLKVLRAMEGWRLVEDPDGARGWILAKFISRERHGYVVGHDPAEMHEAPDAGTRLLWVLEPGVVAKLGDCGDGWCKVEMNGRGGFVKESALFGVAALK